MQHEMQHDARKALILKASSRVQVPQPADLKALENIGFFLYFQGVSVF